MLRAVLDAFLLSRSFQDTGSGLVLELWASSDQGPVRVRISDEQAVCFVPRSAHTRSGIRKPLALRTLGGSPVDALYFSSQRDLLRERDRLLEAGERVLEGDLMPTDRFLMERFITGGCTLQGEVTQQRGFLSAHNPKLRSSEYQPKLRTLSLDIETDGLEGAIYSIALVQEQHEQVLMVGSGEAPPQCTLYPDQAALLRGLCVAINTLDPDLIIGWNVIEFDFALLLQRARELGVRLALGRDGSDAELIGKNQLRMRIAGRVVLDGMRVLRSASYHLESYALDDVARELLGRGKAMEAGVHDRAAEVKRLYEHDRAALARYNLEDCRLVRDVFAKANLIDFLIERQRLTGLALDRERGAVAAFDYLYLPRLHREGYVADSIGSALDISTSPGGYVMDSLPGLYENVVVLDFKSLYPSIIRTFRIDPLGLWLADEDAIPGFSGASFHRERHVLPGLIETLWLARDEAKRKHDEARSYAIKILMNSFYGVLGTTGCRFFDPKLVSSITLRGHEIITRSRTLIEAQGLRVIYGDTDSLFVWIGAGHDARSCQLQGEALAVQLNTYWRDELASKLRIDSQLEVELDTHYTRFFMPTLRDSERGSKKRYAGLVYEGDGQPQVMFKGLEAVRTDWTPLARRFQRELYRRVFMDEPFEEYVRELSYALTHGQLDGELVYRKRLRRELDDYVKNVPPHVQAARQLSGPQRSVSYVMTVAGPEPVSERRSALDYRHYMEKQLAPAADAILQHLGTDFMRIAGAQLSLF